MKRFYILILIMSMALTVSAGQMNDPSFSPAYNAFCTKVETTNMNVEAVKAEADRGYACAQFMMGILFLSGAGVEVDQVRGAKYIIVAADSGLPDAQVLTALLYADGQGVAVNYDKTEKYLRMAVDQNFAPAKPLLQKFLEAKAKSQAENRAARQRAEAERARIWRRENNVDAWGDPR